MKYLTDYTEQEQTRLFDKYNIFFAFSAEQFNDNKPKEEGLKYVSRDAGMYQGYKDKKELKEFDKEFDKMLENAIKQDLKENGKEKIIERELNNHECYYTGEIDQSVIDSLSDYNISKKEIIDQFNKNVDNYELF
jgi:hypothetical protein